MLIHPRCRTRRVSISGSSTTAASTASCTVHHWRKTFTQATGQLPAWARCLARLREHLADAVLDSGRAVEEVAASYGVAHRSSAHTMRGFLTTTSTTSPPAGMSRTRCFTQACTRVEKRC